MAKFFFCCHSFILEVRVGSEGIYNLLLFCQAISAILLPPSVIPLLQLSSSRLIMDAFRFSHLMKFLCMTAFMGMIAINGIFIMELLFGNGGWAVDLRENMGNGFILLYSSLILIFLSFLFFMLFLFFTPLRLVSQPHIKTFTRELQKEQTKQSKSREENDSVEFLDNNYENSIAKIIHKKTVDHQSDCSFIEASYGDPETNVNSEQGSHTSDLVRNPVTAYTPYKMESISDEVFSGRSDILNLIKHKGFIKCNKENHIFKRGVIPENDQSSSSYKPMESSYISDSKAYGSNESMMTDKSVNVVSGKEAASELGRGGKRQLATILDEFWGLLFDYHGKLTKEAKNIRADILLGLDYEPPTYAESEIARKTSLHMGEVAEEHIHLNLDYKKFWTKNHSIPSANFIGRDKSIYSPYETLTWGGKIIHSISGAPKKFLTYGESERLVLQSLRFCIRKLLRLDRSGWLFNQNGGPDEELINYVVMTERLLYKDDPCEVQEDLIIFLPNMSYCSKGCIWQASLVVSFGVWCVRRILELLVMESRPDLWGKYTFVLNRFQGILDPAFCKPRKSLSPCKCLKSCHYSKKSSCTTQLTCRSYVLELIKGAEASTLGRRGQAGTGGGNVAFPKGKENVASVLKRYKRRLTKLSA